MRSFETGLRSRLVRAALLGALATAVVPAFGAPHGVAQRAAHAALPLRVVVSGLLVAPVIAEPSDSGRTALFGAKEGTSLGLSLLATQGFIAGIDQAACRLDAFTDDRGRNLLTPMAGSESYASWVGLAYPMTPPPTATRQLLEIYGPNLPTTGATAIVARGQLAVRHATTTAEVTGELELREGASVRLGEATVTVEGVFDNGEGNFTFQLKSDDKLETLARIEAQDGTSPVRFDLGSRSSSRWNGAVESRVGVTMDRPLPRVRLRARRYTDLRTVTVPFDLRVSVGSF